MSTLRQMGSSIKQNIRQPFNDHKVPHIIGIASGKGGVGKSNLSINLAWQLAKSGQKVLLFDADFGLGNTDILLGIHPENNLDQVIHGEKSISDVVYTVSDHIDILAAGSANYELANASSLKIDAVFYQLEQFSESYDHVIIDTGAGISENVRNTLLYCDEVIIITTPEPASLTDSYASIKMVSKRDPGVKFGIVVNMVENMVQAKRTYYQLSQVAQKFLGIHPRFIGAVPRDERMLKAILQQKVVSELFPGSASSLAFKNISQAFTSGQSERKNILFKNMIRNFLGFNPAMIKSRA